jgi:hypothetical protein
MGSFSAHIIDIKVTDVSAAQVRDPSGVVLVAGQ